jgi:hypothetical protein
MQSAYAKELLELRLAHEYLGMFRIGEARSYPLTGPLLLQQNYRTIVKSRESPGAARRAAKVAHVLGLAA